MTGAVALGPWPPVGLVPAAGRARRLGRLPCSKEILPLGNLPGAGGRPPRVACESLLGVFRKAGVREVLVVLREGKWDIPAYLGSGAELGLDIAYRVVRDSPSVPDTLAAALPWLSGRDVLLGFPDLLYQPLEAGSRLLAARGGDPLALALFPCDRPDKADMVELDAAGRLRRLWIKAARRDLPYTWGLAAWGPEFSALLGRWVESGRRPEGREAYAGDAVEAAVAAGMRVPTVAFPEGSMLDLGTTEDLERAVAAGQDRPTSRRGPRDR